METSGKLNDEENDFAMNIDTDQEDFLDISEDNADEMQMDSSQASKGSSNFGNKTDCEDELNSKAMRGKATDWITEVEFTSKKEYLGSPALQDLVDNYNMHSKKINKDGDITRVFLFLKEEEGVCLSSKASFCSNWGQDDNLQTGRECPQAHSNEGREEEALCLPTRG